MINPSVKRIPLNFPKIQRYRLIPIDLPTPFSTSNMHRRFILSFRHPSSSPLLLHRSFSTEQKLFHGPSPLQEFSVVYTDRALNHMSIPFQKVMIDISTILKTTYKAKHAVIIPGSGTFGMEAVARQLATNKKVMILRNGFFSFRWSQIFDMGGISSSPPTILKARCVSPQTGCGSNECSCGIKASYMPAPIDEVVATIAAERPAVVFAPHVETSTGMYSVISFPTQPSHLISSNLFFQESYFQMHISKPFPRQFMTLVGCLYWIALLPGQYG